MSCLALIVCIHVAQGNIAEDQTLSGTKAAPKVPLNSGIKASAPGDGIPKSDSYYWWSNGAHHPANSRSAFLCIKTGSSFEYFSIPTEAGTAQFRKIPKGQKWEGQSLVSQTAFYKNVASILTIKEQISNLSIPDAERSLCLAYL